MVSAVAWALLDYASQHQDRGSVEGFDAETYAVFSGFDESDVLAVIQALVAKEMIFEDRWASWEKRQPEREDNSAERVRRHREARATGVTETPTDSVTHGNAVKRTVTHGNAPDTDTDTDTEQIQRESTVPSAVEEIAPQVARPPKSNTGKKGGAPKAPPPAEIATIRTITGRYPDKALWDQIVVAVSGKSEDHIKACYAAWVARGFNPTNYAWLLEWVPNGIPATPGRGRPTPNGLPAPEMLWGTVQAEIDRVHYFGTPELPKPILAAIEAVGGWYNVCKCDPEGATPARLRDAYRSALTVGG